MGNYWYWANQRVINLAGQRVDQMASYLVARKYLEEWKVGVTDKLIQMAENLAAMMVRLMVLMTDSDLVDLKGHQMGYRWAGLKVDR